MVADIIHRVFKRILVYSTFESYIFWKWWSSLFSVRWITLFSDCLFTAVPAVNEVKFPVLEWVWYLHFRGYRILTWSVTIYSVRTATANYLTIWSAQEAPLLVSSLYHCSQGSKQTSYWYIHIRLCNRN